MMTDSLYSPVRMFGGGRRESRNQIPIDIKVLAISKIQSGEAETGVEIIKLTVGIQVASRTPCLGSWGGPPS